MDKQILTAPQKKRRSSTVVIGAPACRQRQGMRNGEIETHHSGEKDPPTRSTDTHSQRLRFRFQKQRSPEAETPLESSTVTALPSRTLKGFNMNSPGFQPGVFDSGFKSSGVLRQRLHWEVEAPWNFFFLNASSTHCPLHIGQAGLQQVFFG